MVINTLAAGQEVLDIEIEALQQLRQDLNDQFTLAVKMMLACKGRVVVSGIGKSGHIGRKIAATLASTGTPSFFVHPAEANHGDLGMITQDDVVLAISNSGKSEELMSILPIIKRHGTQLITITGHPDSPMAKVADIHLLVRITREACPLNLAPTASTTATVALGDALSVALLKLRGFNEEDFARSHPGGTLGKRLLTFVSEVMRTGDRLPTVHVNSSLGQVVLEMSKKQMGMTAVLDDEGRAIGMITDGDIRRLFEKDVDVREYSAKDVMSPKPHTVRADELAVAAVQLLEKYKINQLLVLNEEGKLEGALNIHDLFLAKIM